MPVRWPDDPPVRVKGEYTVWPRFDPQLMQTAEAENRALDSRPQLRIPSPVPPILGASAPGPVSMLKRADDRLRVPGRRACDAASAEGRIPEPPRLLATASSVSPSIHARSCVPM